MEKKDVMYVVAAFCIILVIALVVKPMLTGKPVNIGIPGSPTSQPTTLPLSAWSAATPAITPIVPIFTPTPTPTPSPTPTWNASVKNVQFVDPASYGISLNQSLPNGTRIDAVVPNTSMTTYATIPGQYSGTTQIIHIPFPYWELMYTIEPATPPVPSKVAVVPTKGEGAPYSGFQGSYSSATAKFSIQVIDADDPNRIVRTITPPGGIDLNLWKGIKRTNTNPQDSDSTKKTSPTAVPTVVDPRPWIEKFYEGGKNYYFIIDAQSLTSYKIDIRVPTRYIGKY